MSREGANTPALWDRVWGDEPSAAEDVYALAKEEQSVRWRRIEAVVRRALGGFQDLRVIEIGAGVGTYAALMARRGARATLLDYSERALARARAFLAHNGLAAEVLHQDALALPKDLHGRFDVAMSFGLTEHFTGEAREIINRAHFDVLRPGGLAFISVPNRYNPPYRLAKAVATPLGLWKAGDEHPYSRGELAALCRRLGVTEYGFLGDSLFWSLRYLDPVRIARTLAKRRPALDTARIRPERGTPLDAYLAYALVLHARK